MKKQGQASSRQAPSNGADKMKVLAGLMASVFALSAQAATSEAWVATSTKAHDPQAAVHVAPLRAGEQVNVVVSLKLRNKAELDSLTAKLMVGAPGVKPLTSAEFMAKHAPTAAQAQAVVAYLRAQGFSNIDVAPNNLLVSATGGAGVIRNAFKADLHEYNVNGRRAYANVTDALVPAHLAGTVMGVVGLQNVHMMHTHAQHMVAPEAVTPQAITGVSIPNFASIYGASSLPSATTGTIGIITAGKVSQTITDLKSFASSAGYPVPNVTTTVVGTAGTSTSGVSEWNMDSQSSLAAAGGSISHMILYNVTDLSDAALTNGYNKAVTDNLARAINVSLGGCESNQGSVEASQDQIFQSAVAQGQMFSVSSGDSGAYECGATAGKAQSYPAVSPYVMAIGGTTLSSSGGTYTSETVWSCTSASSCQQSSSGGAGGGPSLTENAPSWQTAAGVLGSSTKRGVPDISFDASPQSGALVLVNGSNQQIGGTSLAAPLWAGFWTRIQAAHGNTLPFPAATIYQGASAHPAWFHDVTSGNQGYAAATGWDYASGYGSVQIAALSASLGSPPPPPPAGPTANFTDTVSGLTVSFVDTSTDTGGTITSRSWNFGDSSTSTAQNPTHTYAASGSYNVTETVTDSNAKTASHNASVTVGAPPPPPSNLFTNGGLETSVSPWAATSGVYCNPCSGQTAHGGTGFAWLNGYGSTHTDSLSQTITIPAGKTSATLSFYMHIDTKETGSTAYDKLTVTATPSGGSATTLATYTNVNAATGYVLKTISLTSFIGKTVVIKFNGVEDSSLATSFVLDDLTAATN
ncbi:MAG: protease pro-enzyme activation domain-containing protein [Burkholderiaceae bacterium]